MGAIFDALFSGIAALLAFCYSFTLDYALAIAVFTLLIMIAFTPLTLKSTKSMMAMQRLQPDIKRLQQKHKDDRQALNQEMMALYQAEGVNPLGGCLPLLIQMPIFIILFQVLRGLTRRVDGGTDFDPKYLDDQTQLSKDLVASGGEMVSIGIDLARQANEVVQDDLVSAIPYVILVGITALTSWYQQRQMAARRTGEIPPQQQAIMKIMPWMLPVFSFFMPAGLVVYFIVSNLYRVGQQAYIQKTMPVRSSDSLVIEAEATPKQPKKAKQAPKAKKSDTSDDDDGAESAQTPAKNAKSTNNAKKGSTSSRPRPQPRPRQRQRPAPATPPKGKATRPQKGGSAAAKPRPTSRTGGSDGMNRPSKNKKKKR